MPRVRTRVVSVAPAKRVSGTVIPLVNVVVGHANLNRSFTPEEVAAVASTQFTPLKSTVDAAVSPEQSANASFWITVIELASMSEVSEAGQSVNALSAIVVSLTAPLMSTGPSAFIPSNDLSPIVSNSVADVKLTSVTVMQFLNALSGILVTLASITIFVAVPQHDIVVETHVVELVYVYTFDVVYEAATTNADESLVEWHEIETLPTAGFGARFV
jgi:hypothetical protein